MPDKDFQLFLFSSSIQSSVLKHNVCCTIVLFSFLYKATSMKGTWAHAHLIRCVKSHSPSLRLGTTYFPSCNQRLPVQLPLHLSLGPSSWSCQVWHLLFRHACARCHISLLPSLLECYKAQVRPLGQIQQSTAPFEPYKTALEIHHVCLKVREELERKRYLLSH